MTKEEIHLKLHQLLGNSLSQSMNMVIVVSQGNQTVNLYDLI